MTWTADEIKRFNLAQAIQNEPLDDDGVTCLEDAPIWVVVVDDKIFIRAAQGTTAKWYQKGIKNGGMVRLCNQVFPVKYVPITNPKTIKEVTNQFLYKYHWQLPVKLMISDKVAKATLELDKSR